MVLLAARDGQRLGSKMTAVLAAVANTAFSPDSPGLTTGPLQLADEEPLAAEAGAPAPPMELTIGRMAALMMASNTSIRAMVVMAGSPVSLTPTRL